MDLWLTTRTATRAARWTLLAVATTYGNDALGRTLHSLLPDGAGGTRDLQTSFDGDGNTSSETLPSGALHDFTYSSVDSLRRRTHRRASEAACGRTSTCTTATVGSSSRLGPTEARSHTATTRPGALQDNDVPSRDNHTHLQPHDRPADGPCDLGRRSVGDDLRRPPPHGDDVVGHRGRRAPAWVRHELPRDLADAERQRARIRVR